MLALCGLHGVQTVQGLAYPPDVDHLRDIGFIQGLLDGNWFGDPVYAGEIRWYPPLVPTVGATAAWLLGVTDLPRFWVSAGPWLNLLVPATFFLAARRMLGSAGAAAMALGVFVLFDGALGSPWVAGGYTPWPFVSNISQSLFFFNLWLIAGEDCESWRSALLLGVGIGLTAIAHTVPGLLLTVIVGAVVLATRGFGVRSLAWLGVVAAIDLCFVSIYLGPLAARYSGIENSKPLLWVEPLMQPSTAGFTTALLLNGPGLLAVAGSRSLALGSSLVRKATILLGAWVGVCLLGLVGHYGCALTEQATSVAAGGSRLCRVLAIAPAHHYSAYLQPAWAMLIGFVGWQFLTTRGGGRNVLRRLLLVLLFAAGALNLMTRPFDAEQRRKVIQADDGGALIDLAAYRWILANTQPDAAFATNLSTEWGDPAAFAVYAAGRKLIAAPVLHSNPYVRWEPRDAYRRQLIDAATSARPTAAALPCLYAGGPRYLLLLNEVTADETRVERVFVTDRHTVFRMRGDRC